MAWLGLVTWIIIYWCLFLTVETGRVGWGILAGWLLPVLAMAVRFRAGMQVNGLMVLICFGMFLLCRRGLSDICGWNIKQRRKRPMLFRLLYVLLFLLLFYSVAQAQIQGYFLNLQGWGSETMPYLRMLLVTILLLLLNRFYTEMAYTTIDRIAWKERELVLLSCRCFLTHESGAEKVAKQGCFLEGIHNGVTYHFQLTRRTYAMLRREKSLRLQIRTGILGGLYFTEPQNPDFCKRVRRRDRKYFVGGLLIQIPALLFGIWLFWFL